jgi:hypothetical protein
MKTPNPNLQIPKANLAAEGLEIGIWGLGFA